jgi:hypothetical protein
MSVTESSFFSVTDAGFSAQELKHMTFEEKRQMMVS